MFSPLALAFLPRTQGVGSTELLLQAVGESPRCAGLVRAKVVGDGGEATEDSPEAAKQDPAPVSLEVGVFFRGEDGKDVVVLVEGFAVVAAFLLVPPVAVGVAELTLDSRRVDIAAVHVRVLGGFGTGRGLAELETGGLGSGGPQGAGQRARRSDSS